MIKTRWQALGDNLYQETITVIRGVHYKNLAKQKDGNSKRRSANSSGKYTPILIHALMQVEIWGVVTGAFRRFQ